MSKRRSGGRTVRHSAHHAQRPHTAAHPTQAARAEHAQNMLNAQNHDIVRKLAPAPYIHADASRQATTPTPGGAPRPSCSPGRRHARQTHSPACHRRRPDRHQITPVFHRRPRLLIFSQSPRARVILCTPLHYYYTILLLPLLLLSLISLLILLNPC